MKKLIKTLTIFMMGVILILPAATSVQAKNVNNDTKEVVIYSTKEAANAFIITDNVNLRKSPSTSSPCLGQLNSGDLVYAISAGHDTSGRMWYRCNVKTGRNKGLEGYVAAEFVTPLVSLD